MSILVVDPRAVPRIIVSGCSDLWRRVPIMRCYGCWVTTLHDDEMIDNVPFSLPLSPTYQNTSKRNRETRVIVPIEGQLNLRCTTVYQEYLCRAASRDGQGRANTNQRDHCFSLPKV